MRNQLEKKLRTSPRIMRPVTIRAVAAFSSPTPCESLIFRLAYNSYPFNHRQHSCFKVGRSTKLSSQNIAYSRKVKAMNDDLMNGMRTDLRAAALALMNTARGHGWQLGVVHLVGDPSNPIISFTARSKNGGFHFSCQQSEFLERLTDLLSQSQTARASHATRTVGKRTPSFE
jgi:hypothetical protein